MSQVEKPVVREEELLNKTKEGDNKDTAEVKKNNKNKAGEGVYSDELRSRFGEAFLPFATMLESIEKKEQNENEKGKIKRKN